MTVELNVERWGIELTYDKSEVAGETIDVKAENEEDGDVSTRGGLANDGHFTWTYPKDYTGSAKFTVTGSDGGEDTGVVELGNPVG